MQCFRPVLLSLAMTRKKIVIAAVLLITVRTERSNKKRKGAIETAPPTVTAVSGLDSEFVIHRKPQFLFAAKAPLNCLYRNMPEQELNLIQFAAGEMT